MESTVVPAKGTSLTGQGRGPERKNTLYFYHILGDREKDNAQEVSDLKYHTLSHLGDIGMTCSAEIMTKRVSSNSDESSLPDLEGNS